MPTDQAAWNIIESRDGLVSNWWRHVGKIRPAERNERLTPANLNRHVNHFADVDPATNQPFGEMSPFISLTAGTVERDAVARTNHVRSALQTALWFGSRFNTEDWAYLYWCWVVVGFRAAVEVQGVAEEVRDLNTYRRYSDYQTEGEIIAKVQVPDNHISRCEKWIMNGSGGLPEKVEERINRRFTPPAVLDNVLDVI